MLNNTHSKDGRALGCCADITMAVTFITQTNHGGLLAKIKVFGVLSGHWPLILDAGAGFVCCRCTGRCAAVDSGAFRWELFYSHYHGPYFYQTESLKSQRQCLTILDRVTKHGCHIRKIFLPCFIILRLQTRTFILLKSHVRNQTVLLKSCFKLVHLEWSESNSDCKSGQYVAFHSILRFLIDGTCMWLGEAAPIMAYTTGTMLGSHFRYQDKAMNYWLLINYICERWYYRGFFLK